LLALIGAVAGAVLLVWLRRPDQAIPQEPPGNVTASPQGWEIRYNATLTLLHPGSPKVRLPVLLEMLDRPKQMKNFRAKLKDGRDVPNEAAARSAIISTLKAVVEWHQKLDVAKSLGADSERLQEVYAAIDRLADSPNLVLRTEAERTRKSLNR